MLIVLAEARFDPTQADKVRAVARPMIEASRAEPGCAGYDYAFDLLEPDLMRVRELWRDEQALKDHFATPHMAVFLKGLRELRPECNQSGGCHCKWQAGAAESMAKLFS